MTDVTANSVATRYRPGQRLVWEPSKPHARCRLVVQEVRVNEDGEEWVATTKVGWTREPERPPRIYWNEADRHDEARGTAWERFLYWWRGYPDMEPIQ